MTDFLEQVGTVTLGHGVDRMTLVPGPVPPAAGGLGHTRADRYHGSHADGAADVCTVGP